MSRTSTTYRVGDRITIGGAEFEILTHCPHHPECWSLIDATTGAIDRCTSSAPGRISRVWHNPNFPERTEDLTSTTGEVYTVAVKHRSGDYIVHASAAKGWRVTHVPTGYHMWTDGILLNQAKKILPRLPQGVKDLPGLKEHRDAILAAFTEVLGK